MANTYQILNGDALLSFFPEHILSGEIIVARECLVDGPVGGNTLDDFWKIRADFIASEYDEPTESYFEDVAAEFDKILHIPQDSEVNLWFEEDLFCQVNLWFCISLLRDAWNHGKIHIVKPPLRNKAPDWRGFGALDRDGLAKAYQDRKQLSLAELHLLNDLWIAYKTGDRQSLEVLKNTSTSNFPFLSEVVQAHLDRFSVDNLSGRPERVLKNIMQEKKTSDFRIIFPEWSAREGIYGFGDSQVESILKKLPEYNGQQS